jgi:ComF family protein
VSAGEQCGRCLAGEPAFDATVAAFRYEFPLDELIKALKFSARLDLAAELAAPLARALAARGETFDAILAVPLSRQRLALRGFDQAEVIADALARTLDAPRLRGVLAKTRDTPPQAGLERAARLRNVRGAYELRAGAHLAGLRIALVDDVMTTGATLREAARVLKAGAAARVTACVLARAGDDLGGDPRADAAIS